ncbi:hypothetical protein QTP86_026749, partial [Hemibagrus guttatus]
PQNCRRPALEKGFFVPHNDIYEHDVTISYGCDSGLKPALETWWGRITCSDGKWSHIPQCINKTWCITPHVPNAQPTHELESSYPVDATVAFQCNRGYQFDGTKEEAECVDGSWKLPQCKRSRYSCGAPARVNYVIITQPYQDAFEHTDQLHYVCAKGYKASRGAYSSCSSGSWYPEIKCERITCGKPVVRNGETDRTLRNSYNIGDKVQFKCRSSYEFVDTDFAECVETGTWNLPECRPRSAAVCKDPRISHGRPAEDLAESYPTRSSVRFECDRGYVFEESAFAVCINGQWDLPVCKRKCSHCKPDVFINTEIFKQDNAPCHKADMLQEWFDEHSNQFEVLTWPPNSPDLNPIQHLWDVLDNQVHGGPISQLTGLKGSAANILVPDPTAHLQGPSGVHALTGQGCFGSKRRNNTILDKTWCITPHVPNAQPTHELESSYPVDATVAFQCNRGYQFDGTKEEAECVDGSWKLPQCKRSRYSCGAPARVNYVIITQPYQDAFEHTDRLHYVCAKGYKASRDAYSSCSSGSWYPEIKCERITCGKPVVRNGETDRTLRNSYNIGDKVQFKCRSSYEFVDTDFAECVETGTWNLPECRRKCPHFRNTKQHVSLISVRDCGDQPLIENGDVSQLPSGKELRVQCKVLYKRVGPEIVRCGSGGWTELPVCK